MWCPILFNFPYLELYEFLLLYTVAKYVHKCAKICPLYDVFCYTTFSKYIRLLSLKPVGFDYSLLSYQ